MYIFYKKENFFSATVFVTDHRKDSTNLPSRTSSFSFCITDVQSWAPIGNLPGELWENINSHLQRLWFKLLGGGIHAFNAHGILIYSQNWTYSLKTIFHMVWKTTGHFSFCHFGANNCVSNIFRDLSVSKLSYYETMSMKNVWSAVFCKIPVYLPINKTSYCFSHLFI